MKVLFTLSTGFVGAEHKETIEFEDDITDKELEEEWNSWIWNHIDGGYERQ